MKSAAGKKASRGPASTGETAGLPSAGWIASVVALLLVGVLGLFVSHVMAIVAFVFAAGIVLLYIAGPKRRLVSARLSATRLIEAERYDEALAALLKAERAFPLDLAVKTTIALVLKRLGRAQEAEGRWAELHSRQRTDYASYYYAKTLRENGKPEKAIRILEETSPRPALAVAYFNLLGCCHLDRNETDRAIRCFTRAPVGEEERDEATLELRGNLARALEAKGDSAKALEHYRFIAAARPDDGEVRERIRSLSPPV